MRLILITSFLMLLPLKANTTLTSEAIQTKFFLNQTGSSEGADYNTLYGGKSFKSYAYHPNKVVCKWKTCSTAAGKYQILDFTWRECQNKLHLKNFSPENQDKCAVYLIGKEPKAAEAVKKGRFNMAKRILSNTWTSFK